MTITKYVRRLKSAAQKYDDSLTAVALTFGGEVLDPFCRKWGVQFCAGMGTWSFYAPHTARRNPGQPIQASDYANGKDETDPDERAYFLYDLPDAFWQEFAEVSAALDTLDDNGGEHGCGFVAAYFTDYPKQ